MYPYTLKLTHFRTSPGKKSDISGRYFGIIYMYWIIMSLLINIWLHRLHLSSTHIDTVNKEVKNKNETENEKVSYNSNNIQWKQHDCDNMWKENKKVMELENKSLKDADS